MEINRNEQIKTVEVWLTKAERDDQTLREALKPYYQKWKTEGYLPVVYLSGDEDLYDNTLELLKRNRDRTARREVEAERTAGLTSSEREDPTTSRNAEQGRPSVRQQLSEIRAAQQARQTLPAPEKPELSR